MNIRFLTDDEVVTIANPLLRLRGWPELNTGLARVMAAFDDQGIMVEMFAVQMFPMLGPLLRTDNQQRDNGATSRALSESMVEYLRSENARGYMTVADSPITERLCERYGMKKLEQPVYLRTGA